MTTLTTKPRSDYSEATEMFHRLATLVDGSYEYRRQREEIIQACLPLADHIARRFGNRGEPLDDLVQVARLGLMHAVTRFDPNHGAEFVAFAVPTMMGEVRRHFRDRGWAVKVPRRLKELGTQLNRSRDELSQQLGRSPTATEISVDLGLPREEVVQALIAHSCYATLSADAPLGNGDGDDDRTVGNSFGDLDRNLEKVLETETLRPLIAALPQREQLVLTYRFFDNMTQSQIADRIGVSQMHVSRLLARSLATLRDSAEARDKR